MADFDVSQYGVPWVNERSLIKKVVIGSGVTNIGNIAFLECRILESVEIPNTVTIIGGKAFENSSLLSINIPSSVTEIEGQAFLNCNKLNKVIIEDGTGLLRFTPLRSGYDPFGRLWFTGCLIQTLHLGRNISSTTTFSPFSGKTTLTTLTIGSHVTEIPDECFSGCTRITEITSKAGTPPVIYGNTFRDVPKTIPVKVPCVTAYQFSDWRQVQGFSNFEQTGTCPSDPNPGTLNVLSSNASLGHATSTSMKSGLMLTSTWNFGGNFTPVTSASFSGKAILTASAKKGAVFQGWDDGNTEPVRIVDIAANAGATYTAQFAACSQSNSINNVSAESGITLYPNPAKGEVFYPIGATGRNG